MSKLGIDIIDTHTLNKLIIFINNNIRLHYTIIIEELTDLVRYGSKNNLDINYIIAARTQLIAQMYNKYRYEYGRYCSVEIDNVFEAISLYDELLTPVTNTYNKILESEAYDNFDESDKTEIYKPVHFHNMSIANRAAEAKKFESVVIEWFSQAGHEFETEDELKISGVKETPDILFKEPITVTINGYDYIINWLEIKSAPLIGKWYSNFMREKLKRTANVYNCTYGSGAFIFKYPIPENTFIPDVALFTFK